MVLICVMSAFQSMDVGQFTGSPAVKTAAAVLFDNGDVYS